MSDGRPPPSWLHRFLRHRWWGDLQIDYGIVRWRCCGEIYGEVPAFKDYPGG